MRVWMSLDPETRRVSLQETEFADGNFPLGLRGLDWEVREGELHGDAWDAILQGGLTGEQISDIHRSCWIASGGGNYWPDPEPEPVAPTEA